MSKYQIKLAVLFIFSSFIFTACSNDDDGSSPDTTNEEDAALISSDVALQWMDLFMEIERYAEGMRPNASARAIAYINLAAYETVVPGMEKYNSCSGKISQFQLNENVSRESIDFELALNSAYADVLNHFILNAPASDMDKIAELESNLELNIASTLTEEVIQDSRAHGASVASQIIAYSQTDGDAEDQILDPQPTSYVPPRGDGFWTFSAEPERALFPYWGRVRTFVISPNQTTSVAPISYSENPSSPYYAQMTSVYNANNEARNEDGEQLWIAEFWSDDVTGLTFGPPSRQVSLANQLIRQRNVNLGETLRLNLKLGFALNDAAVSTWKYKYEYMVMRPSVFIQDLIDADYQTNLFRLIPWPNPSFPGYPSGHSCFSSAAAGVFIDFFGNQTAITDRSHEGRTEFRGSPRSYSSLDEMAEESAYSRIPLGVHIDMDCTEGLRLGYEISDAINRLDVTK